MVGFFSVQLNVHELVADIVKDGGATELEVTLMARLPVTETPGPGGNVVIAVPAGTVSWRISTQNELDTIIGVLKVHREKLPSGRIVLPTDDPVG